MAIDIFTTRAMVPVLRQNKPVGRFLLDTLFGRVETSDTEYIDIDIVKGNRKMAPFVSPRVEGVVIEDRGFTTNSYKPAYIKQKFVTTAADVAESRVAGESLYGDNGAVNRSAEILAEELLEHEERVARREEWMAAQLLTTGKVDVVGEGINQVVDFGLDASHNITLSGTDLWSDAGSDPLGDLATWQKLILKDSGMNPDILIGDTDAISALVNHADVKDTLDTRRVDMGMINPRELAPGVVYWGNIISNGVNLDVYSYTEWYTDDSDVDQPIIPAGQVIMTSTRADFRRHYGAIKDLKAGLVAIPRFVKSWEEEDPSARFVLMQSAPLPAVHQIDALLTAKAV